VLLFDHPPTDAQAALSVIGVALTWAIVEAVAYVWRKRRY
jgi:hypothetical protein